MDTVLTESIWLVNMSSCVKGMQKIGLHELLGSLGKCEVKLFEWEVWNLCLQTYSGFMWKG